MAGGKHLTSSALDELVASIVHWSFAVCGDTSAHTHETHSPAVNNTTVTSSHPLSADEQRSVTNTGELDTQTLLSEVDSLANTVASKLNVSDGRCVFLSRQVSYFLHFNL